MHSTSSEAPFEIFLSLSAMEKRRSLAILTECGQLASDSFPWPQQSGEKGERREEEKRNPGSS
jgi:hypothetical protein